MSTLASAHARLQPAERRRVEDAFVTTDAARDTPAGPRRHVARFDPALVGVARPPRRVEALGRPLDVEARTRRPLPDDGDEVLTAGVVSVPHGRADLRRTAATSPSDLSTDLHKILEASS